MGIFHKLMCKLGRYRLITDRHTGENYMHRYYLFLTDRAKFPFNVTLHKIVKSDDPIMHDHPWSYITIILSGGYYEHVPFFNKDGNMLGEFIQWRGPGSIIRRKAKDFHWLELESGKPATTLFFMGPQKRDWGFLVGKTKTKRQWIQWENYLTNYKHYHQKYIEPKVQAMSKKKQ